MEEYSVGILGLGNIGMGLDYDKPDDDCFLTHVKSFNAHPKFKILYLIDKDKDKLRLAGLKYKTIPYLIQHLDEIEAYPDILVLASQPEVNKEVFDRLKDNKDIKLFILEKPFWNDSMKFENYQNYSEKCVINYFRKFIPFYNTLKEDIDNNKFGQTLGVHINYCKGLRNSASHFIDLINFLYHFSFDPNSIQSYFSVNDYSDKDLSIGFTINFRSNNKQFPVLFQPGDATSFFIIELDFLFEKGRLRISDFESKFERYEVVDDPIFEGYKNLKITSSGEIEIKNYGYNLCDYVYHLLQNKDKKNISSLKIESDNYVLYNLIRKTAK